MSISKRLRFEILKRDDFKCQYCGLQATETGRGLAVDHVIPEALGGESTGDNLITSCKDCNSGKSSIRLSDSHIEPLAIRSRLWSQALAQATEGRRGEYEKRRGVIDEFLEIWNRWTYERNGNEQPYRLPPGYTSSIAVFLARGLEMFDLEELVEIAMTATIPAGDRFKYFCGCAWKRIRTIEESLHIPGSFDTAMKEASKVLNELSEAEIDSLAEEHGDVNYQLYKDGFIWDGVWSPMVINGDMTGAYEAFLETHGHVPKFLCRHDSDAGYCEHPICQIVTAESWFSQVFKTEECGACLADVNSPRRDSPRHNTSCASNNPRTWEWE